MREMAIQIANVFKEHIEEISIVAILFLVLVVMLNYYNVDLKNTLKNKHIDRITIEPFQEGLAGDDNAPPSNTPAAAVYKNSTIGPSACKSSSCLRTNLRTVNKKWKQGFCSSNPELLKKKCLKLTTNDGNLCSQTDCCIFANYLAEGSKRCIPGDNSGPIFDTIKDGRYTFKFNRGKDNDGGALFNEDYFYYKGKCVGSKCPSM